MTATHDDSRTSTLPSGGWLEAASVAGFAENWDMELFGIRIPAWRWPVVRAIETLFHGGDGRPIVVADMGCGAATNARHLLTTGIPFEYHGFDHNDEILESASERWRLLPGGAPTFRRLDARSPHWPVADARFDIVLWDSTIRFVEDVPAAIRESFRVARQAVLLARTPLEDRTWRESVSYYGMQVPSTNWHFDRDFFDTIAAEHGWQLSTSVGDPDLQVLTRHPWPEAVTIRPGANPARTFHAAYVRERVDRLLVSEPGAWALYGAGRHTRWLLGAISPAAGERIQIIVDDAAAAGQTLGSRPVLRPAELDANSIVGVIVSSDMIEERLATAALAWLRNAARVHRLYEELPPGPYDKTAV